MTGPCQRTITLAFPNSGVEQQFSKYLVFASRDKNTLPFVRKCTRGKKACILSRLEVCSVHTDTEVWTKWDMSPLPSAILHDPLVPRCASWVKQMIWLNHRIPYIWIGKIFTNEDMGVCFIVLCNPSSNNKLNSIPVLKTDIIKVGGLLY